MTRLFSLFAGIALLLAPFPALAKAPESASPALWVVKDADTTIYLFGSVHVLKPGTLWFDDEVKAAFDASDELVLEMVEPPAPEMAKVMGELGMATDGKPLSEKLDATARAKYLAAMADAGIPWQGFERFQPWMPGVMLSVMPLVKGGYLAEEGVEKILSAAAATAGKPVIGLETASEQLGYFAGLPEAQQIAFLNETVNGLPKADAEFANLIKAWKAGKPDSLGRQMNRSLEATPELAQVLLFGRNAKWADWIANRLEKPGTLFIAVGAGHLAGPRSVIADLSDRKIAVKRVTARDFKQK
ncbi:TraB/GumN family protein [Sphingobium phenoxybenzoativorans]|uniref:TraB/GumN family protein n=1 Tax=Sphingobium phenoxybenzoativorans TaxID=1592790 RepID=A0A975K9J9_9SPHN|nr:TraB/GumN family protein [Sphingobium phenoxybenzoativorans]QUT07326.1 TraB/GumN family protein [Sphingobium phenoxybenzoativorans]